MNYEIFAHHAHLYPQEERPAGALSALLHTLDACGIARCVAFAPMPHRTALPRPNEWLAQQLLAADGRLVGFGVIDLRREDITEQVEALPALGLRGIKLHPASQQFHLMGERACHVYAAAERLSLPISFHTGVHFHRIMDYNMLLYDEIAYHYPRLRFSMEHVGGYSFFREGVAVMVNNMRRGMPYAGLTSVCDREQNKFWYLTDEQLLDLAWQTGNEHLIFGLDFPYNDIELTKRSIARFKRLFPQKETQQLLFGGNLEHFING